LHQEQLSKRRKLNLRGCGYCPPFFFKLQKQKKNETR
jgi:hypothetical protein